MSRLLYFWIDLVIICVDLDNYDIILAWKRNCSPLVLRQVRPDLPSHIEALKVAFTEFISGRAPEQRGNGLKYVRRVVSEYPMTLFFATGDAELRLKNPDKQLLITRSATSFRGCLAVIEL